VGMMVDVAYINNPTTIAKTWLTPPDITILTDDEVHVWRADLSLSSLRLQALQDILAPDEQARAASFHLQKDQARFIAARGLLRVLLSRYLDLEPAHITFSYGGYGKPALTNALGQEIVSFNMSHSGQLALYAITRGRKIGVDVECLQTGFAFDPIAERFFSPREVAALRALPPEVRPGAFFNGWTRKEAFIKARGQGLSLPLNQFEVSLAPGEPARLLYVAETPWEAARWSLQALEAGDGYAAAVAVEGHDWRLKCWQWQE
jgi:4'-phosphopantetheinyl transferase